VIEFEKGDECQYCIKGKSGFRTWNNGKKLSKDSMLRGKILVTKGLYSILE